MSYNIQTRSVNAFVSNNKIKLPRFQRKSTWTHKQKFELAISIFQDYPVGVVIINEEAKASWLLDGRQRRTALKEMREDPDLVYGWAKKYIKFKTNEEEDELKKLYWAKVETYLQSEKSERKIESSSAEENDDDLDPIDVDALAEAALSQKKQRMGLQTLLDIILMVHRPKKNVSRWERILNIKDYVVNLPYCLKRDGFVVRPIPLRDFLLSFHKQWDSSDEAFLGAFMRYLDDNCTIIENQRERLEKYISNYENDIRGFVDTIAKSEQIFEDAQIGVILLSKVTPLDAQNIFSRVNSGGTNLKAEELLSAKPFWNEPVQIIDANILQLVKNMYQRLGVEVPADDSVVRWDLGATLLSRIKDYGLLFEAESASADSEIEMSRVTLGFKLMSSNFIGGMSAIDVSEMEKSEKIDWNGGQSVNILIDDINHICEILRRNDFFNYLIKWKKPIARMGSAIVLEFITILRKSWKDLDEPSVANSKEMNQFIRSAKALFDRLVYEYAIGSWRGSGDSKMARHIENWKDRVVPVDKEKWTKLIESSVDGDYDGHTLDIKHLTPILSYQYALLEVGPESPLEETSEVDHIIPQAKLDGNLAVPAKYKDSLFNLVLLPRELNNEKKDKCLIEISKSSQDSYAHYSQIPKKKFKLYSDVANIEKLKDERIENLKKIFGKIRLTKLSDK